MTDNNSRSRASLGIPGFQPWPTDITKLRRLDPDLLRAGDLSLSAKSPVGGIAEVCDKTENIIIIGSELQYDSFWLKMMFMACGYAVAKGILAPPGYAYTADLVSILIIDYGYTDLEKERLIETKCNVVMIKSQAELTEFLVRRNKDGNTYKIRNIVVFSHGFPNVISLNYKNDNVVIDIDDSVINALSPNMFTENAIFFSYACRTGAGTDLPISDPKSDESLAQYIANKLRITVRAFYRRTFYGRVLRDKSQDDVIRKALKRGIDNKSQTVIDLLYEHEALPHPGLGAGWEFKYNIIPKKKGPEGEGTANYALWRKHGARELPTYADSPDFDTTFAIFRPKS